MGDAPAHPDTPLGDDAGADAGTEAPLDAPLPLDAPVSADVLTDVFVSCAPREIDAPTTPACIPSTFDCILAATTSEAQAVCVAADPMGATCAACLEQDLQHQCTTRGYCRAEVGALACCLEVQCPGGDAACIAGSRAAGGACNAASQTLIRCTNAEVAMRHCGITGTCAIR